jgi:hypothetical protein
MAEPNAVKNAATASLPWRTPYQGAAVEVVSAAEGLMNLLDGLDVDVSAHWELPQLLVITGTAPLQGVRPR